MSRFNKSTKGVNKTTNYEQDVAYKLTPELELYSTVCTSVMHDKFYENNDDTITRLRNLIGICNPVFVAKLAVYAREKMYLRTIPLVLTVELAKIHNRDQLVSKTTNRVIQRADELTELLAYYKQSNKLKKLNKLSKQLQKGIGQAFNKFNEYEFGKYDRANEITLKDALFLSHPKPKTPAQQELFDKIVKDTLTTPYTWEVELSKGNDKKTTWEELIESNKLGYMGLLRNLRNLLDAKVSIQHINTISKNLADEKAVLSNKQFPFRYLSAYRELTENENPFTSTILTALEEAILISSANIQGYGYDTTVLIASDVSGSMRKTISAKSKIENYDIGLVLSMLLQNKCKSCITGIFGDIFSVVQLPKNSILQNVTNLKQLDNSVGYSTNGYKVIDYLLEKNISVDKIIMFTDNQMWNSSDGGAGEFGISWERYKRTNPTAKLYLFDLAGYGMTPVQVNENNVYLISGWNNEIFNVLANLEHGESALDNIKKVNLNETGKRTE